MSRRLVFVANRRSTTSVTGFRTGGCAAARACALSASIGDGGRAASLRARICLLEARHLGGGGLVARIVLGGEPEFAAGGVELALCLEFLRAIEVLARRGDHRALERDLV